MKNNPLPRLDIAPEVREQILPHCRLQSGETWVDLQGKHKVACLDATDKHAVDALLNQSQAQLAIADPPYNLIAFQETGVEDFISWCKRWIGNSIGVMHTNGSLYVWLGADQNNGFQPLPDFMIMMRDSSLKPRSFITMRNQRGYGTQKNWMAVRQELLYYTKGNPTFNIEAEYTDIPKILRGYYKQVGGTLMENTERGKSENIRAGNVWVDVQQVFYRMEENVSGCYAQKPLKCIERIIRASSNTDDLIIDFFAHSGTTLLAAEILNRRCFTADIDPVFCEITIRRLERYRNLRKLGWQNGHPFEPELGVSIFDSSIGDAHYQPLLQNDLFTNGKTTSGT
ncbi:MAG: site-specific DNA-methyltransferase [Pyrinomonadaceae bacterium MAG19_C2-C3]|nr:site-specific DNA-methyltransferase [Pyrinomonadaceae bacterium MAG19_C2-C3]